MPNRAYSASANYRFGFNGKENNNEVKGYGNELDYGKRIYDPRIGRFRSLDPLAKSFAYYSPYQFSGNKVINSIDLDGEEEYPAVLKYALKSMTFAAEVGESYIIDVQHWRHFYLLIGVVWGLIAVREMLPRRDIAPTSNGLYIAPPQRSVAQPG